MPSPTSCPWTTTWPPPAGRASDIDLIWGAVLTRYLTLVKFAGYGNVRSSGRVQTPTLAIIVERERERMAFVPEDYWVIRGAFDGVAAAGPTAGDGPEAFEAPHATARFKAEAEAAAVMARVEGAVSARGGLRREEEAPQGSGAGALQHHLAHGRRLGRGLSAPPACMRIAESLYMDGYISYPRVDNTVYPDSLDLAEVVNAIAGEPCLRRPTASSCCPPARLKATRGKTETTDHPPIYPTAAGHARRPVRCRLQAVQPHRPPLLGDPFGAGHRWRARR